MFGSTNTFDPNKDIPSLAGKTYIVTGGSAGIGYGICAHLLQHNPAKLYLLGNKEAHLAEAETGLARFGDTSKVETIQIDLQDLHQTDRVAKDLAARLPQLDGLVCNAGIGVGEYSETADGIDSHMQINVFAQHHLAMILLPLLQKTPGSRLVFQSSEMHRLGTENEKFASLEEMNRDIGATNLYCRSKLAQILLVRAFARRKAQGKLGLRAGEAPFINATHPGAVSTDQPDQAIDAYGMLGKLGVKSVRPFMKDPVDQGCRSALFAVASQDVVEQGIDGQYIVPDRKMSDVSKKANDEDLQERCWRLTESVLRERLGELGYDMS
jgi:WW domain-containing oxidoreductase